MSTQAGLSEGQPFQFRCLRCRSVLEARSNQSGHQGRCPSCGGVFTVPAIDPDSGLPISNADPGADGENPTPVHAYAAAGELAPQIVRRADDSLVIVCRRCERESPIDADYCAACGLPFTIEGATERAVVAGSSEPSVVLALGIIAILACWCPGIGSVPGMFALIVGLGAMRSPRERAKAAAGAVLGAIGAMISLCMLFFMNW